MKKFMCSKDKDSTLSQVLLKDFAKTFQNAY